MNNTVKSGLCGFKDGEHIQLNLSSNWASTVFFSQQPIKWVKLINFITDLILYLHRFFFLNKRGTSALCDIAKGQFPELCVSAHTF